MVKFDYDILKKAREEHSKFWTLKYLEDGYKKGPPVSADKYDFDLQDSHIRSIIHDEKS